MNDISTSKNSGMTPEDVVDIEHERRLEAEREERLKEQIEAREIYNIGPDQMLGATYLRDLWAARQLLLVLIGRELRVRYKQTIFGGAWVVLQLLLTVCAYSIIFGLVERMSSKGESVNSRNPCWAREAEEVQPA